jgi:hypothetical protein
MTSTGAHVELVFSRSHATGDAVGADAKRLSHGLFAARGRDRVHELDLRIALARVRIRDGATSAERSAGIYSRRAAQARPKLGLRRHLARTFAGTALAKEHGVSDTQNGVATD